jgi:hypothetical protein
MSSKVERPELQAGWHLISGEVDRLVRTKDGRALLAPVDPSVWRRQIADFEFLEGEQWTPEQIAEMKSKSSAPILVGIDWGSGDATSIVVAPDLPRTELRPPPEHADKPLHWIEFTRRFDGDGNVCREPMRWSGVAWWGIASVKALSPADMIAHGYRYLGPAEYAPHMQAVTPGAWTDKSAEKMRRALIHIVGDQHPPGTDAHRRCQEMAAEVLGYDLAGLPEPTHCDPAPIDQFVEHWPPHAMAARIVGLEAENARLKSDQRPDWMMKTPQIITPTGRPPYKEPPDVARYDPVTNRTYAVAPGQAAAKPTAKPLPSRALRGGSGVPR